ncbi:recombinase family protein [Mesotoga sp. TolDC]|uniref:recombinase family protein n=1 Tax=unclassified Mesotoga TaxID=1184398 RepID=UPI0015E8D8E5
MAFKRKRAATYARYSSQHQTELSVEGQTERILEYCKKNGFEIVKEYADRGVSAFLIEKRLDFQKLIQDALESKFDYVIVWSTDRFARSPSMPRNIRSFSLNTESKSYLSRGLRSRARRTSFSNRTKRCLRNILPASWRGIQ